MSFKPRTESTELIKFRFLNPRITLSTKEKKRYLNLEKGYQGEVMFDQLTEKLQNDLYILNDLCLEFNNSVFQIDTLIIAQELIYPFEVKNFEGDYYYESESFHSKLSKEEIKNPLDQLKRSKSLLRPFLKKLGIYLPVEGLVTFVNPEFTLYQAPLDAPIIYPTQLNHLMKKLNQIPSKLNYRHKKLADQLVAMHLSESPYAWKPIYTYEKLKKGIICPICFSFMLSVGDKKLVCEKCGCEEEADTAVLRSVGELKFLFPDKKITTSGIHEWCKVIESKKMIRRILLVNYRAVGERHTRYFEID
ncbi:NERD domain-containing protein [Neobacillus novalis]|uniref:NERD domain-containing protein n=1 Tax=Neobacillus novalis TaxID=220687 RepID=A0AA95S9I9_9BACI|nr:NERD domain-containing protein [Neobacillus novalis]WHY84837.1 NERD domain-containing protein [Neobacillus novalis]